MELPQRKKNRLLDFDYSTPNAYFVTVCTDKHKCVFWESANSVVGRPQDVPLSPLGKVVKAGIERIPIHYSPVSVEHYVIMPNHVHVLLRIASMDDGRPMTAPTISMVVNQFKGYVTKAAGVRVWQKGFYDHVVRSDADYCGIWEYIDGNPSKWAEVGAVIGRPHTP